MDQNKLDTENIENSDSPKINDKLSQNNSNLMSIAKKMKSTNNKFIAEIIEKLKNEDDMSVLNTLYTLSNELSMANDSLAEDQNCHMLIQELIQLFDKFYLPDISLFSLQCLNFLLDINPAYTSTIKKHGGFLKIVIMTQNIEFIDLAENSIKAIEKMSLENSLGLLESDAFVSVLNFIDFFDINLKKSAIKACVNMSLCINTVDLYTKYVLPAIPSLSSLTKFEHIDISVNASAIQCFYHVLTNFKSYGLNKNNKLIEESIMSYGVIENLYEIVMNYINIDNFSNNMNKNISFTVFRNILKIFQLLCTLSSDATNLLLNMNILEIIYSILNKEINRENTNFSNNLPLLLNEIFPLLIYLFPDKNIKEKILTDDNKHFYNYFSEKILNLLMANILNVSSSHCLILTVKLLSIYIELSPIEQLEVYIQPSKISPMIAKILDTNESNYIEITINLIEMIMKRVPEMFIISFMREGIIESLQNFKFEKPVLIQVPKIEDNFEDQDEGENEEDILNEENNENYEGNENVEPEVNEQKPVSISKENEKIVTEKKNTSNLFSINPFVNNNFYGKNFNNSTLSTIENRIKECKNNYFTDEKIKEFLSKINQENPLKIILSLEILKIEFEKKLTHCNISEISKEIKPLFIQIFNILLNKDNKLSFFEIEKSGIFIVLAKFLDENFLIFYDYLQNENENATENFILSDNKNFVIKDYKIVNFDIISKIKILFECLNNDLQKIKEFTNVIQFIITSMNCFKLYLGDLPLGYNPYIEKERKYKVKLLYKSKELNNIEINDENLLLFNENLSKKQNIEIEVKYSDNFYEMEKIILKINNILNNDNLEVSLNFYLQFIHKNIQKTHQIKKEWTTNDVLKELYTVYSKDELKVILEDLPISFDIDFSKKILNQENKDRISMSKLKNTFSFENLFNNMNLISNENLYEDKLFEKFYLENIVTNKNLYCIKRLAPFLYILSLLNLSITKFHFIFNLENNEEKIKNGIIFENSKVSNLLIKQVRDHHAISYNTIPSWCKEIPSSFPFLANFNSRYLLFKVTSFDSRRGMINLLNYIKNFTGEHVNESSLAIAKNRRHKVLIERSEIIFYTQKMMKELANFNGYLEFEYLNETGTGIGPTLEFYSQVCQKIINMNFLWYKTTNNSLFPSPINKNSINHEENKTMFQILGFVIARSLYDDRLINIPLSNIFWDSVLERPINFYLLYDLDADLGNAIKDFLKIIKQKQIFLEKNPEYSDPYNEKYDLGEIIKYNNTRIDELGILFNLPGLYDLELKQNGLETILTIYNIEEYVQLIYDKLLGNGISDLKNSFKTGFNLVFPIDNLKAFYSKEIEESLLGSVEYNWQYEDLYENIIPNHGYDKNSSIYKYLLKLMLEIDNEQKRKFLLFITGTQRLPYGGNIIK